ncbi:PQQ-dependent sugar dehydrogenase [Ramlibacter rhizophilus]|uniref:PQQ-dependent sugar dehydrogenase n=1 Tax=Ramlibacter rhizophilus TaxID=1781167 RepID=A0A4Z0BJH8_9BURK|nr:PQQ-dependent sugar dehydrogenase [Ramlibacter rhizophilus]TFY98579.1 PQQ-dependent sugar dehydrogenase [Ramlibacter rhizophilus]
MSTLASITLSGALLGACLGLAAVLPAASHAGAPAADAPRLSRTVVMSGLQNPWDIAFTPDGVMLFTEKCRGLSARLPDGKTVRLFGTAGSALVAPDLFCQGQSGVHGIAVDPEFAKGKRDLYLFMASRRSTPATNRVVRLTLNADSTGVSNRTDIVDDIAFKESANAVGSAGAHSGGMVRFGPDGFLYVTSGDNHNATLPQDLKRLGGKVLRVNRDGSAAPGNNTPAGGDPRIFTYGHRNVQGITFRPAGQPNAGQPFTGEHGPNHSDEVTALVAGGNAGWDPQNRPRLRCPDDYCGYAGDPTTMPMTDTQRFPQAMPPSWVHNGSGRGMSAALFLDGAQWKAWNGDLLVSLMRGQRIVRLDLDARGMAVADATVDLPSTRTRTLVQGPDGNLYTANDDGEIWRVAPN